MECPGCGCWRWTTLKTDFWCKVALSFVLRPWSFELGTYQEDDGTMILNRLLNLDDINTTHSDTASGVHKKWLAKYTRRELKSAA
jgi:hypothetical protein